MLNPTAQVVDVFHVMVVQLSFQMSGVPLRGGGGESRGWGGAWSHHFIDVCISMLCRVLREVGKQHADSRLGKGKTEVFQMTVEGGVFSEYPGTKVRSLLGNPPRAIHQHHGDQPPLIKISCYINFWRSKDKR